MQKTLYVGYQEPQRAIQIDLTLATVRSWLLPRPPRGQRVMVLQR